MAITFIYSSQTDTGNERQNNQDSCNVFCLGDDACFAVVCDGMGGYNGGEIASKIAVDTVSKRVSDGWRNGMTPDSAKNLLLTSISAANIFVYDKAHSSPEFAGMGTTVIAALIIGDRVVIAHAGDSRAYICGATLIRITKDHSYVQALLDAGIITGNEADHHPDRHVITKALGINEHIDLTFTSTLLRKNEKLLLCSDGLTNFVSEEVISDTLKQNSPAEACEKLISAANANGGGDNITAVVVSYQ
ncbi:MAG: Stp1/IreP family PP2C-type Ser/Thr phosphatase [Clostridia bacterium]|nr:Stp1/IreP family PP2C-type Ser/Thr phosphatase [Clostridia bacterium]